MNRLIFLSLLVLTLSQTCPNCESGCALSSTGTDTCSQCDQGYAIVTSIANTAEYGAVGTCTACQTGCASCQFIQEDTNSSPCGPTITPCGNNGMYCNYCNAGYATVNGICYACPAAATVAVSQSNGMNGLTIGLIITSVLTTLLAITFIVLYIRSRQTKGENSQGLLTTEIEVTTLRN